MIIFMGVAGSGKSIQGRILADELALPWLSTGEFLRMLVSGERRKDMIAGKLLSDNEIIALVQRIFTIIDPSKEFILDGFPRTTAQADWLIGQIKHGQLHATAVIHLVVSKEAVHERLLSRGRPDDTIEAIAERLSEYDQAAKPILQHFTAAGVPIFDIDGSKPVKEVQSQILSVLKDKTIQA
ncbi:MAG: nucleoside monophosphate kinase [Candidatus Saccharibacteria bacterium]|nr:nucleoside monophosphate kinase [Candidatus Saccharibacteria bacterium]